MQVRWDREGFRGDKSNSVRIEGVEELQYALASLPERIGNKYVTRAVRLAMPLMEAQLLANTPVGPTGNLRAAVGSKVRYYRRSGVAFGVVGYKRAVSEDTGDNKGYHSHFIEFGTAEREPREGPYLSTFKLAQAGYMPPGWDGPWPMMARRVAGVRAMHPMRSAFDATHQQCTAKLTAELAVGLQRGIEEVKRKGLT
jgi:HK97 gp10 family phage protein